MQIPLSNINRVQSRSTTQNNYIAANGKMAKVM